MGQRQRTPPPLAALAPLTDESYGIRATRSIYSTHAKHRDKTPSNWYTSRCCTGIADCSARTPSARRGERPWLPPRLLGKGLLAWQCGLQTRGKVLLSCYLIYDYYLLTHTSLSQHSQYFTISVWKNTPGKRNYPIITGMLPKSAVKVHQRGKGAVRRHVWERLPPPCRLFDSWLRSPVARMRSCRCAWVRAGGCCPWQLVTAAGCPLEWPPRPVKRQSVHAI